MNLQDLMLPADAVDVDRLLNDWEWLIGPSCRVVLVTKLGDAFVLTAEGSVIFLDTLEGIAVDAAPSVDALKDNLRAGNVNPDWFSPDMVAIVEGRGDRLAPGECFAYTIPPVLGGSLDSSNVKRINAVVHFSVTGQLHRQIKDFPPGTKITGFTMDDSEP